MATEFKTLSTARLELWRRADRGARRGILDHATDPQTGWVWVCLGGSADAGWHWAAMVHDQGVFNGLEFTGKSTTHDSLQRAILAGIRNVKLQ